MPLHSCDTIYDYPDTSHDELAEYHSQKEWAGTIEGFHSSRFKDEQFHKPTYHYREP